MADRSFQPANEQECRQKIEKKVRELTTEMDQLRREVVELRRQKDENLARSGQRVAELEAQNSSLIEETELAVRGREKAEAMCKEYKAEVARMRKELSLVRDAEMRLRRDQPDEEEDLGLRSSNEQLQTQKAKLELRVQKLEYELRTRAPSSASKCAPVKESTDTTEGRRRLRKENTLLQEECAAERARVAALEEQLREPVATENEGTMRFKAEGNTGGEKVRSLEATVRELGEYNEMQTRYAGKQNELQ